MTLSVSLSEDDVAAVDRYVRAVGLPLRSAAIRQAIRLLGDRELEDAYAAAWDEWEASGDALAWEATTADGPADAARGLTSGLE
jgi:Arc/MetJ-type ribon-helix-helix transcriptional regulator